MTTNRTATDPSTVAPGRAIADMGQRIARNGGEPYYSAEKAHAAAKNAMRVIPRADARLASDDEALERLIDHLRHIYRTERDCCSARTNELP